MTLFIVGLSLVAPLAAFASCPVSTDPNKRTPENTNVFLYGWIRDAASGDHFDDIQAKIQARNPNLPTSCLSNGCSSYAWEMLTTQTQTVWAQYGPFSGIWRYHNPATQIGPGADYTECNNTSTGAHYDMYVTTTTVGNSPNYEIKMEQDPNGNFANKVFYKDGTREDWCGGTTGGGTTLPFTFTPDRAQNYVEIHDISTQVPGSQANHEQFRFATVHDLTSGTTLDSFAGSPGLKYISPGGTLQQRSWMGSQALANNQNYDFWDDDCP